MGEAVRVGLASWTSAVIVVEPKRGLGLDSYCDPGGSVNQAGHLQGRIKVISSCWKKCVSQHLQRRGFRAVSTATHLTTPSI